MNCSILDKYDSEVLKGVHAQIGWCKILGKGIDRSYGVGVKYFEPTLITYQEYLNGEIKND